MLAATYPTTTTAVRARARARVWRGLLDRVEALDGRLYVTSPAGGGTIIRAELPCAS
jgi:hypothetical protein